MDYESKPEVKPPFTFEVIEPYTSTSETSSPFVIGGLFKEGGLNALVSKPKQGKSSLSRYAAVCVAQGTPFLGQPTERGEVLLISIEDPIHHVNACLRAIGYDNQKDERIHVVPAVASDIVSNVGALRMVLQELPGVRLVVIDTLAKFVRVRDINDYNVWLVAFEQLRQLGKEFPHVSILCLLHAKKSQQDDPFDSMLGSSALRGEFDTNAAIYRDGEDRVFVTESRMGKAIQPTILHADVVEVDDTEIVRNFSLDRPLLEVRCEQRERTERKRKVSLEERVIAFLGQRPGERAPYGSVIAGVEGNTQLVTKAVTRLIENRVLIPSGTKGSPIDPYTVTLNRNELEMHDFISRFDGEVN